MIDRIERDRVIDLQNALVASAIGVRGRQERLELTLKTSALVPQVPTAKK